jgi:hypothetical protein
LESILEYTVGRNRHGDLSFCYYFNLRTGTHQYWSLVENRIDPYFSERGHHIVLITDGRDTCEGVEIACDAAHILFSTYGLRVHVLGFGIQSDSDKVTLDRLAREGGTNRARFIDSFRDLVTALNDLTREIGAECREDPDQQPELLSQGERTTSDPSPDEEGAR